MNDEQRFLGFPVVDIPPIVFREDLPWYRRMACDIAHWLRRMADRLDDEGRVL